METSDFHHSFYLNKKKVALNAIYAQKNHNKFYLFDWCV